MTRWFLARLAPVLLVLYGAALGVPAAGLNYVTSWLGNSFGGADKKWVQNYINHMVVTPDGTCYTDSHWDEGGRRYGIYKDGDVIGNKNMGIDSHRVTDRAGRVWVIQGTEGEEKVFTPTGITRDGVPVDFPEMTNPMCLALANDGTLMIGENGPRQQVMFYDITGPTPRLVRTFGERGGIGAGVPGVVTPRKLWGLRGIGMDAQGNIYVGMSQMGAVIRKFTPQGKLVWELYNHAFVDVFTADPTTDGRDIWGAQEHYRMDYRKGPGKEATWVGYSLDTVKYPEDPRGLPYVKAQGEHGITSAYVRYIQGKRFLFTMGMTANFTNIFKFDGEIAKPSGYITMGPIKLFNTEQKWPPNDPRMAFIWRDLNGDGRYGADEYQPNPHYPFTCAWWVDQAGNVWTGNSTTLMRYDCQGLDRYGNPIYQPDKFTKFPCPPGLTGLTRIDYDSDRDIMVVGGNAGWRAVKTIIVCRDFLRGNRDNLVTFTAGGPEPQCMALAGEYVFTGGWKGVGKVWVNRISDGKCIGVLVPGPEIGGAKNTGWIDITQGITAFKRHNGEYLVMAEEDYLGKVILYRWDGKEPDSPYVEEITPGTLPDLIITDLGWTPANPAAGDRVVFTATIKNVGVAATPDDTIHGVAFRIDGEVVSWSDDSTTPLAPGASRVVTACGGPGELPYWIATAGQHTLTAEVDDVSRFIESNGGNNTRAVTLTVP